MPRPIRLTYAAPYPAALCVDLPRLFITNRGPLHTGQLTGRLTAPCPVSPAPCLPGPADLRVTLTSLFSMTSYFFFF